MELISSACSTIDIIDQIDVFALSIVRHEVQIK
jgi:hypothetical protein